ncbi:MAG: hypothetical protein EOO70_08595 [Myxococcaceae bacterium]|nr:MAG: hypothetical protein EOO70_08595 [Myxococcaceae bacterium]
MSAQEQWKAWLLEEGFAEERPGFGHVDAETLASAIVGRLGLQVRPSGPDDDVYGSRVTVPMTGQPVPEMIVPRHELTRTLVVRDADDWWARLSGEQKCGLSTMYRP